MRTCQERYKERLLLMSGPYMTGEGGEGEGVQWMRSFAAADGVGRLTETGFFTDTVGNGVYLLIK